MLTSPLRSPARPGGGASDAGAAHSPAPQIGVGSPAPRLAGVLAHGAALLRSAIRAQRLPLVALAAMDLALIAGFVAFARAEHYGLRDSLFYGNVRFSFIDDGYPEMWGYAKEALIVLLLGGTQALRRQPVYRALALLFAVVLTDDAFAVHEALGGALAAATGIVASTGELLAWAALGLVPMLAVAAAYRRSDRHSRADAEAVLAGFALLIFFAVGMDEVHSFVHRHVEGFQTLLTLAEDGGELLTLTLLCALALGIVRRRPVEGGSRLDGGG